VSLNVLANHSNRPNSMSSIDDVYNNNNNDYDDCDFDCDCDGDGDMMMVIMITIIFSRKGGNYR